MSGPGVVVVGTSFGCLTHVRGLRNAGFDVRAVVGRDEERTRERAARFDVPLALTDLQQALELPGVEAVSVATPPASHHDIVLAAIDNGLHVLCEKPFALDQEQARAMHDAAQNAGVVHLLGTEFRYATAQALLTRQVRAGAVGNARTATFVLDCPLLADPGSEVPDWWRDADQGGGWLGAYGSHVVDQIRATLGEFEAVNAQLSIGTDRAMTADDGYTVQFRLQSGCIGVMASSTRAFDVASVTRIVGDRGTAWLAGDQVMVADADGQRAIDVPDDLGQPPPDPPPIDGLTTTYELVHTMGLELGPFTSLARVLAAQMAGDSVAPDPAAPTFADGVAGMAVLDAIRQSAAAGGWVTV
ncbi:MAG: Gfo/Idh/MocA family protein [Acidimicrobiales bacterium]